MGVLLHLIDLIGEGSWSHAWLWQWIAGVSAPRLKDMGFPYRCSPISPACANRANPMMNLDLIVWRFMACAWFWPFELQKPWSCTLALASQRIKAQTYGFPFFFFFFGFVGLSESSVSCHEPRFDRLMVHGLMHDYGRLFAKAVIMHARLGQSAHQGSNIWISHSNLHRFRRPERIERILLWTPIWSFDGSWMYAWLWPVELPKP